MTKGLVRILLIVLAFAGVTGTQVWAQPVFDSNYNPPADTIRYKAYVTNFSTLNLQPTEGPNQNWIYNNLVPNSAGAFYAVGYNIQPGADSFCIGNAPINYRYKGNYDLNTGNPLLSEELYVKFTSDSVINYGFKVKSISDSFCSRLDPFYNFYRIGQRYGETFVDSIYEESTGSNPRIYQTNNETAYLGYGTLMLNNVMYTDVVLIKVLLQPIT
jgi:hypothetical protein